MRRKCHELSELTVLRDQFEVMFDAAVIEAKRMDLEDMKLPRRRRVPARIVEGVYGLTLVAMIYIYVIL